MGKNPEDDDSSFETFLKGVFMGLADIVPGVSGGTIALIVGIYEKLISAIKSINLKFIIHLLRTPINRKYFKKAKQSFSTIDVKFLLPLAIGMVSAFIAASQILPFVLKNYPAYIYSFFFGLILISAGIVYRRIEKINLKTITPGITGFLFASLFVWSSIRLGEIMIGHSLPIIFVSGFLAICAMILPGISGSFIVLFLGQYEYMLNALSSIRTFWIQVIVFLIGALVSLLSFSRLLSHLLKNYHSHTLFFLTGLMIGALLLPFNKVINSPGIPHNPTIILGTILSGLAGATLLILVEKRRIDIENPQ